MSNLDLWARLSKTDPAAKKDFRGRPGGFSGTAIDPMWRIMRLTEEFGPAGTGWSTTAPEFSFHPVPTGEILIYCTVGLIVGDGKPVYGVGGDVAFKKFKNGNALPDDEACKKAFTDALMNAAKHLGLAGDIYMNGFDADKYIQQREGNGSNPVNPVPTNGQSKKHDRDHAAYQDKYVKAQAPIESPPPAMRDGSANADVVAHDPETGEVIEDPFAGLDDLDAPEPIREFSSAKEMLAAIEGCPSTTELTAIDLAYQKLAPDMSDNVRNRLSDAIMSRVQELSREGTV
ncbi:MAG: hypothetical protein ACR2RE_03475 [Geminicoccaceae bacterium]